MQVADTLHSPQFYCVSTEEIGLAARTLYLLDITYQCHVAVFLGLGRNDRLQVRGAS